MGLAGILEDRGRREAHLESGATRVIAPGDSSDTAQVPTAMTQRAPARLVRSPERLEHRAGDRPGHQQEICKSR